MSSYFFLRVRGFFSDGAGASGANRAMAAGLDAGDGRLSASRSISTARRLIVQPLRRDSAVSSSCMSSSTRRNKTGMSVPVG